MRAGWLILLLALVAGCATLDSSRGEPTVYVVKPGDTLYSIAWRHGTDYRTLARHNHIEPPYVIQPGLRLRVGVPRPRASLARSGGGAGPRPLAQYTGRAQPRALAPHPVRTPTPLAQSPGASQPRDAGPDPLPSRETAVAMPRREAPSWEAEPQAQARPRPTPRATVPPAEDTTVRRPVAANTGQQASPRSEPPARPAQPPARRTAGGIAWQWPVDGPVLSPFSVAAGNDGKSGINIGGEVGRAVAAAASGRVVYSGSGLRGYGNLIIIKHDASYLTAYGYNQELLVSEGDSVQGGQTIASMGLNSSREPALHFELRRDGQAIDPLTLLPPR